MPGTMIPLFTKRQFDFGAAAASFIVIRSLDVSQWTEGVLQCRLHSVDIGASGQIDVEAYPIANTAEEPDTDYVSGTAAATVSWGASDTAPDLGKTALTSGFGGAVQIKLTGTAPASGNLIATLSAELVMKS